MEASPRGAGKYKRYGQARRAPHPADQRRRPSAEPGSAGREPKSAGGVRVVHVHRIRGIGGSERHLLTLLPALAERGVDVSFVGLDDPAGVLEPFYRELPVPFERLQAPRDLDPALAYRLARTLRSLRPDIVHTHLVHADVYGVLAPGTRIVSTKHNPDPFRAGAFRFAERALAWRAARVIAISRAVRSFCIDEVGLPAEKVEVVHYGLDGLPPAWAENPTLELRRPLLLAVCRLEAQKGLETAVRALADVPDATLLVLGEGPDRAALESLASSLGVRDRLLLPGRVGDVATLYAQADVVVHPARWEGFGLAMLEAMLAAKPVVAARAGSAPELVDDGVTGVLVPVDDTPALAGAVSSLLAGPDRAAEMGRAGLERARHEFSVARMADRTLAVYRSVLRQS
jgi:glycosyltransferase involved in cell wall biosynthesis